MRVAVFQAEPLGEVGSVPGTAIDSIERVAQSAARQGADLLVLPEAYLCGYNISLEASRERALTLAAAPMQQICTIARTQRIAICVGYIGIADSNNGTEQGLTNSACLIDDRGQIVVDYQKTHLFGQTDKRRFTPGEALSDVVTIGGVSIALAICYDIEFAEVARSLALAGAQLIVVPTANMAPYDSIAQRLVPARAEENGLFVVYANYCGREAHFEYTGLSCVCDPHGQDLARAQREEQLLLADVDPSVITTARASIDYLRDRRARLYRHD